MPRQTPRPRVPLPLPPALVPDVSLDVPDSNRYVCVCAIAGDGDDILAVVICKAAGVLECPAACKCARVYATNSDYAD